jgi:UDP-N-acetylmuramate--alanine ligase
MVPDLSQPQRIHIVAIGGAAMSAIAHILVVGGNTVSGSDQADSTILSKLRANGCSIAVGHDPEAVNGADLVVISTAVKPGNVEYDAAKAQGIPIATRNEMMTAFGAQRRTLAISGTHGKTTTSGMAAVVLMAAQWDPSFIVGGQITELGTGVRWAQSEWLSVEADESDSSFLCFGAEAVIVTNIEADHLDFHGSMANLEAAFDTFVRQATGPRVVCVDDPGVQDMIARVTPLDITTYGTSETAQYRIADIASLRSGNRFTITTPQGIVRELSVQFPGDHVIRNATAVFAMATELGIDPDHSIAALAGFQGVGRRLEQRGMARGVRFVDDYAHLPAEVATNVTAVNRGRGPQSWERVVAVFQPHRFTRIRDVGVDFGPSFSGADIVVITGLYSAGQAPIEGISGRTVFDAVVANREGKPTYYAETRVELVEILSEVLRSGDLCLTMNAGDLTTLPDEMLNSPWAQLPGLA